MLIVAIFQDLGATVEYNNATNTITAYKGSKKIVLSIGKKEAQIITDGSTKTITLSSPAESYKNTTMVPLRFIGEALGATVTFDNASLIVKITTTN